MKVFDKAIVVSLMFVGLMSVYGSVTALGQVQGMFTARSIASIQGVK